MNHEFLKLAQMVEAGRKCNGQESVEITEENVKAAEETDAAESAHKVGRGGDAHGEFTCPECARISAERISLRESLHIRGIDFPEDVFRAR